MKRRLHLDNTLDLLSSPLAFSMSQSKRTLQELTSKNLFSHQTWKTPSPISTASWKILHHLTRLFVLSAVFRCTLSRTTIYDCSSLTWARFSKSRRTNNHQRFYVSQESLCARRFNPVFSPTFSLQGILRHFRFRDVDDSVHIERNFLRVRGPTLITEAVVVFAVVVRGERVVFGRDSLFEVLTVVLGVLDLQFRKKTQQISYFVNRLRLAADKYELRKIDDCDLVWRPRPISSARGYIPRNQSRGFRFLQIPGRRPGTKQSSYHPCAVSRGSILVSGRGAGCCVQRRQ